MRPLYETFKVLQWSRARKHFDTRTRAPGVRGFSVQSQPACSASKLCVAWMCPRSRRGFFVLLVASNTALIVGFAVLAYAPSRFGQLVQRACD
jgi:hypothetical protein